MSRCGSTAPSPPGTRRQQARPSPRRISTRPSSRAPAPAITRMRRPEMPFRSRDGTQPEDLTATNAQWREPSGLDPEERDAIELRAGQALSTFPGGLGPPPVDPPPRVGVDHPPVEPDAEA